MEDTLGKDILESIEANVKSSAITRIIKIGHGKGQVTMEDIAAELPEAEENLEELEDVFAALLSAGIPFIESETEEDIDPLAPTPEALMAGEPDIDVPTSGMALPHLQKEDVLANIDTDDMIGLYIKEASRIPLLTAEEEVSLAQRVERGRLAREEVTRGNVSPERRKELRRLIDDGWEAREKLIVANSRLVISVAKKYMSRGVPFLDLIQEGNIGLMRAAKKFDYTRGFKFSTYATWWIRQAISRAISDQGRTIRVPVHMGDQISRMLRVQHQLRQQLGRDPSRDEVAEALEVTPDKVEHMVQVSRHPLSLQTPVGEDDSEVLGDFIEDKETPDPDETVSQNILREQLNEVLEKLPAREVRVLQLRYGLLDGEALTLNEVGRKLGVTRERVRQLEAQALRRLRSMSNQRELQNFTD